MATKRANPKDLDNPRKFEKIPDVTIFDEHVRKDAKGDVVMNFDKAFLEQVAANNNKRDEAGQFAPLTLGHTLADQYDEDGKLIFKATEKHQPDIVGYARGYNVHFDEKLGKHVIRTTYFIRKEKADEAREYPRTSVEILRKSQIIDPIALLKRTPDRDIGQWTYAKDDDEPRYRYSYNEVDDEPTPNAQDDANMDPTEPPDADAPDEQFMKRFSACAKKYFPHLETMHGKFAADMVDPQAGSGTNTFVPGVQKTNEKGKIVQPPDRNVDPSYRMQAEQDAIRFAKIEGELEASKKENAELRLKFARAECEQAVTQLEAEGYAIPNRAKLVDKLAKLPETERTDELADIRQCFQKGPVGDLVRLANGDTGAGGTLRFGKEEMAKAVKHAQTSGVPIEKAIELVKAGEV